MRAAHSQVAVFAVLVVFATALTRAVEYDDSRDGTVCEDEHDRAIEQTAHSNAPEARAIRRRIDQSVVLLRFHKRSKAQEKLGSIPRIVNARPSLFQLDDLQLMTVLETLGRCLSAAEPPPMATLTVRVVEFTENDAPKRAGAGVHVHVDDIPIGHTGSDGTVTSQVPAGPVRITALIYPGTWGEELATLAPGQVDTLSVTVSSGKHVAEETYLELAEATDGVIASSVESLTLQFMDDDRPLKIAGLESVDLVNRLGDFEERVTELFRVDDGAIVAIDARRVLARVAKYEQPIRLGVTGIDPAGIWHHNQVEFRVEQ